MAVDPPRPFGVVWLSDRLYREDDSEDDELLGEWADVARELGGSAVRVDGWDEAVDTAWEQLVTSSPSVGRWVDDYCAARAAAGHSGLTVVFKDVTRVLGRAGYGAFAVSYPTELLLAVGDPVAAMRAATVTALDRHVERAGLGVPLLSSLVSGS
ncbi:hypothetical protein L2K70_01145 [Nocardioides KLBMP 9356]|uniref:Uncharacterized protein n=1 Tax=Nocardioides potassii TaxID=2911371 RepID=A0ABS9H4M0_9ACTN|nr:hypothetical protein [Nocardioides potassii]MCF6376202.1 hypothetical protein [Nocardioides potassii]